MKKNKEEVILKTVTLICFSFGVLGVLFAYLADSKSMLLDGLYSLIQSLFILSSSFVLKIALRKDDERYQFGYGAFEPFYIALRTVSLLTMNLILGFSAIESIFSGGYRTEASLGIIFTAISIFGCFIVWRILHFNAKKFNSPILKAEARSWINDALLSVAVLISFSLMEILDYVGLSAVANYIDPIITVAFVLSLAPPLLKQLITSIRELLSCAPNQDIQQSLDDVLEVYKNKYGFKRYMAYSSKQGRILLSTIHIFLNEEKSVKELDAIRKEIMIVIKKVWQYSDIDIVFSIDPSWVKYSVPI